MSQHKISAEVMLRPGSGKPLRGSRITAENVDQYRADATAAARARKFFLEAGFEVSEISGLSFSISGARSLFESVFRTDLGEGPTNDQELPLKSLPVEVSKDLEAVGFSTIDFGPVSY